MSPKILIDVEKISFTDDLSNEIDTLSEKLSRELRAKGMDPASYRDDNIGRDLKSLYEITGALARIMEKKVPLEFKTVGVQRADDRGIKCLKFYEGNIFIDFRWSEPHWIFDRIGRIP